MVNKDRIIKKGELFILTEGEYSDYQIITLCRALTDLNTANLLNEFTGEERKIGPLKINPYEYWERPRDSNFPNWIMNVKKVAEEVPLTEWHYETYNEMSADIYRLVGEL